MFPPAHGVIGWRLYATPHDHNSHSQIPSHDSPFTRYPRILHWLILTQDCLQTRSGSFGRLNCCWSSPAQSVLPSGLIHIFDQDFFLSETCTYLRKATYISGTGVGLSRFHIARRTLFCRRCSFNRRASAAYSQVGQA
jgi:hypothetical protein